MDSSFSGVLMETENYLVLNFEMLFMGIKKSDGSFEYFEHALPELPLSTVGSVPFFAVVGIIQFEIDLPQRLILVTEASQVCDYYQSGKIYHIDKIAAIKISPGCCLKELARTVQDFNIPTLKDENDSFFMDTHKLEMKLLDELYWLFQEPGTFYFGVDCDISNTIQRKLSLIKNHDNDVPLWMIFERKYFWNYHMSKTFIEFTKYAVSLKNIICPILRGFVDIQTLTYQRLSTMDIPMKRDANKDLKLLLISKQSFLRAGTRFRSRGVDAKGHVSNYVETEQLLIFENSVQSFVIIRGSIPLFWQQPVSWKYKPPFVLYNDSSSNTKTFNLHMNSIISEYGRVVCINLVDNGGREKVLRDAYYESILNTSIENINFFDFDFHDYCKKGKYENVKLVLVKALRDEMDATRFHWRSSDGFVLSMQNGVFRVNCVDCLDRTNVVQAEISKAVLADQIRNFGLDISSLSINANIQSKLNEIWASNGDNISLAYAGTAALKSDFTRTGERNIIGVMSDGYKSINRYYNNITRDAYRQVVIDVMHGKAKSSIKALEQWKVKLEDSVQTVDTASRALSTMKDTKISTIINFKARIMNDVVKNLLDNPTQFVKLWLVIPFNEGDPTSSKNNFAMVLSRVSILFCTTDGGRVGSHFRAPLSDLLCFESVDEDSQSYFTLATVCVGGVMKQSFFIKKTDFNIVHQNFEKISNLLTSFANENMNFSFRTEKVTKNSEDLLQFETNSYLEEVLKGKRIFELKDLLTETNLCDDSFDSFSDNSVNLDLGYPVEEQHNILLTPAPYNLCGKPDRPPKPVISKSSSDINMVATSNKLKSGIRNIKNWIMPSLGSVQSVLEIREPAVKYGKNMKNKIVIL